MLKTVDAARCDVRWMTKFNNDDRLGAKRCRSVEGPLSSFDKPNGSCRRSCLSQTCFAHGDNGRSSNSSSRSEDDGGAGCGGCANGHGHWARSGSAVRELSVQLQNGRPRDFAVLAASDFPRQKGRPLGGRRGRIRQSSRLLSLTVLAGPPKFFGLPETRRRLKPSQAFPLDSSERQIKKKMRAPKKKK